MIGDAGRSGCIVVGDYGEVGIEMRVGEVRTGVGEVLSDDDVVEDLRAAELVVRPPLVGRERKSEIGERRGDETGDSGLYDLVGGKDVGVGVGGEGIGVAVGELKGVEVAAGDDVRALGLEGLNVFGDVFGLKLFLLAGGG